MRAIRGRIETNLLDPAVNDARRLACADVRRIAKPTREQDVVRLQTGFPDPGLHRIARLWRNFKLHRTLRFLLHDHRSRGDPIAMAHITNPQLYKVAGAKLAIRSLLSITATRPLVPKRVQGQLVR